MTTRVSPTDAPRGDRPAVRGPGRARCGTGGGGPPRSPAAVADRAGGRGHRVLGTEPLRTARGRQAGQGGSRNGYGEMTVKTTAGPVTLKRPKLRGTTEQFASRLFGKGVTRTNALESLVIAGFVRGLSVRDVEAALAEALGRTPRSRSRPSSRVCQAIKDEFDAVQGPAAGRRRARVPVSGRQPLQVPPGRQGRAGARRLGDHHDRQAGAVGIAPGSSESTDAWAGSWRT